ncbi:phage tail protein [Clostridium tertium]|uniref:phage tail protein n=1 Tax=Clostridium tertium TaxID=1559 RepID=UPI001C1E1ED3|nr:phage tail protein [Clostridium tertium]MBU6137356.1 phage tail protein [Clostridium tertium]
MLQLYDKNKNKLKGLTKYKDYCIESVLKTGDKTLSFLYPSKFIDGIVEEGYIRNKTDEFVIKEIVARGEWTSIKVQMNVEDLEGKAWEHFNTTEQTIENCLNLACAGTGWTVQVNNVSKKRTVKKTNCSSWEIIQEAKKIYRVEIEFDTLNKVVKVYEKLGHDKGVYFSDEINLKALDIESNSYDFYTKIIAIGKENIKIEVENFQYSNKVKTLIWKDERYTVLENLREDATAKLQELSKPRKSYSADVIDLANLNPKYKNILDYKLGDTITLISKDKKIREKQRIVKITDYPDEPERNSCEIANTTLDFIDIQKEFQDTADTVNNITEDNGTISEEAIKVAVKNLTIDKADINSLNAAVARIGTLEATKANITELNAVNAKITNLQANKAEITDLIAGNIKFDVATGGTLDLQTLLSKFVTGENGQFLNLTSSNVVIANAVIKDAMIENVSLNKLKAGTIDTNKITLSSADGGLSIVGPTMQFKDKSNRVRLQLGQDTSGNFSFILRGTDGTTTLIDHTGIKEKAIADKLIKSNMVADGAIGEQQINYSSLVTGLNKDTNTSLIQASKVAIDLTGQSLEVAFNSLKSNVDNMEIGGRNLQGNSDFNKPLSGTWRYDAQFMSINEEILCDGYKSVKILRTNATTTSTRYLYTGGGVIPAKYGEEFTMSFMYYIPEDVSQEIDGIFQAGVWFYKDRNAGAGSTRKNLENEIVKGKWIKVVVTGKAKDVDTKSVAFVIGFDKNCEVYISKPKLERGNKATDFTVAPEDVEEKIQSNTTAITVAQGKIEGLIKESTINKSDVTTLKDNYTSIKATVDGINTTVASHTSSIGNLTTDLSGVSGKVATVENKQASLEQNLNGFKTTVSNTYSTKTELNTAKIDAINSANNSTDNKLKNYSTTIAMNTAITQSANSVKTEVSNTYLSKGDATNTYATKASMELTSTQLRLEFKSSGGGNLLKNGRPIRGKRGLANWNCSNSAGSTAVINLGDGGENFNGEVFGSGIWWNGTRESAGGNTWCCLFNNSLESYKFNKGKTYYVSLIIYSSTSGKNININIVDNNGLNHVGGYNITLNAGYQLVQFNFSPAQAGNKPNLGLYLNTSGSYNFYIPWAVVGEGYPVNNWIPNYNEIEDGNTTIDATGVKIYNGALTVLNNNGQVMLQGDSNGNLSFSGRLQPYDYQIRLFGNDCRIDGSAGAIRMQWNPQNYISVENGATRMYDNNSAGGTRYISFATDTEGHANIWGIQTRMKLLGNSSARPVIQSRNISDNAYGDFHGADFLNRSTIKDKTNVEIIEDLDFSKILLENNIFKYNLKTDVENLLKKFGLYEECNLDEVVDSSTDIRLGFILEELTEDARLLLCPGNMESISIYSMCSILWKVCQEQQKRIEALENLQ